MAKYRYQIYGRIWVTLCLIIVTHIYFGYLLVYDNSHSLIHCISDNKGCKDTAKYILSDVVIQSSKIYQAWGL